MKYTIEINDEAIQQWGIIVIEPCEDIKPHVLTPGFLIDDSKCIKEPGIKVIKHGAIELLNEKAKIDE